MMLVSRQRASAELGELSAGGGWRHELALRLAGPASEHHAHLPLLLCHRARGLSSSASTAGAAARVLRRWEPQARLEQLGDLRRVRRPLIDEPHVEIIVCLRDQADLTRRCVDSILVRTDYDA